MNTLHIITGMSGSGKTTVVKPLSEIFAGRMPVWDLDDRIYTLRENGHPEAPPLKEWKIGDPSTGFDECTNIVYADAAAMETDVIVCGTVFPKSLHPATKALFEAITWIGLYADEDVVRRRLAARTSSIWTKEMIDLHATSFTWFRNTPAGVDGPVPLIDTSRTSPDEVAHEIHGHITRGHRPQG